MPTFDVTLPQDTFDTATKTQLADTLTHTLLKWEHNEGNQRVAALIGVFFNELPGEAYAAGGKLRTDAGHATTLYRVWITVPAGVLADADKNGLVGDVTAALLTAEGSPVDFENTLRVYCLIDEVPEGNWGQAGRILRRADMLALTRPQ